MPDQIIKGGAADGKSLLETYLEGFAAAEEGIFYISFATEEAFLGGCFIVASGDCEAVLKASASGISPGGETLVMGPFPKGSIKATHIGRLITDKAEIEEAEAWPRMIDAAIAEGE